MRTMPLAVLQTKDSDTDDASTSTYNAYDVGYDISLPVAAARLCVAPLGDVGVRRTSDVVGARILG